MVGIHKPRHIIAAAITVADVGPCIGHGTLLTVSLGCHTGAAGLSG
jgi:hypothetical protein